MGLLALIDGKKLYIAGTLMMVSYLAKMGLDFLNTGSVNPNDWAHVLEGFMAIGGKSALKKLQMGG